MNQPENNIRLEEGPQDHDFLHLSTIAGIEVRCVGDPSVYTTTGRESVQCGKVGKEYRLLERLIENQSGRNIFMTYIDFGPYCLAVRGSELTEMIEPQKQAVIDEARICRGIQEGTLLPTRTEFQRALAVFHEGKPNGKLMDFCLEHELYEVLTKEYIHALATYLEDRINALQGHAKQNFFAAKLRAILGGLRTLVGKLPMMGWYRKRQQHMQEEKHPKKPVTILEVGAGDGRLTHFLEEELNRRHVRGFRILATDGRQWHIRPRYPVTNENVDMALWDYEPEIVLACWMPRNEDWTAEMRKTPSVQEYILIGPKDSGTCGNDEETWGTNFPKQTPAPYSAEGFERVNLPDLSELQMGQKDRDGLRFSATVSFRRSDQ